MDRAPRPGAVSARAGAQAIPAQRRRCSLRVNQDSSATLSFRGGTAYCAAMNVLLLYPEFPDTFWSFKHALKFIRKRASLPPLGLMTVAAMLPGDWV